MIRIMFICHGNICRSPMAEYILKDMLARRNMTDEFLVCSSATSTEEIGNPVYPPARAELARHGIACDGKRAVQLTRADYDRYDYFLCMDERNFRNAQRILGGDPDGKLTKLLSYAGRDGDVADPWYTGDFEITYRDIVAGCEGLLTHISKRSLG